VRRLGLIHDVDHCAAAEVLLGLHVRAIAEDRRAARRVDVEQRAVSSRPPVKISTLAACISASSGRSARDYARISSSV
jgi:hypothetical protein